MPASKWRLIIIISKKKFPLSITFTKRRSRENATASPVEKVKWVLRICASAILLALKSCGCGKLRQEHIDECVTKVGRDMWLFIMGECLNFNYWETHGNGQTERALQRATGGVGWRSKQCTKDQREEIEMISVQRGGKTENNLNFENFFLGSN